ncbi:hypothetical protein ACHMW6_06110 [Pseudoduganella sp. UC29_106]|uniref:hypothetical protein n=1 Tax=Pseudoduganella sp. UC29_106 TaxID=3374553 RepID=UPI00375694B8
MIDRDGSEARFLKDVAEHQMQVIRDDGVNRHIRFKRPDTSCYYFDLITWPGHLCYTGDMGTYVFQRTTDMFEFFRTDRKYQDGASKLKINLSYWTEKLIAVDGSRGGGKVKEFDEDKFKRVINEYRVGWMRDAKESGSLNKDGRRDLWEAVDDEVMRALEDGGDRAQYAAFDFHFNAASGGRGYGWHFEDLFERDFTEYTHSIVWCCYALAWGIEKYDAAKVEEVAA